ncbi:MAG: ATP-dependent helicase RecG, partial [Actinomycetota bacterium]|nr:ATP-dependent helicase RecG [Actinomycetota bacterium]
MPLTLDSPITSIDAKIASRRTGSRTRGAEAHVVLEQAFGITSVDQLIHHYPRRYIDRSRVSAIRELPIGKYVTVIAHVKKVVKRLTRKHQTMVVVTLYDGTGYLDLTFFNQPWAANLYREGVEVAVSGVGTLYKGRRQLANQEVEVLRGDDADMVHTGRITPVHPASEGISTRTIRELVWRAIEQLPSVPDPVPPAIVEAEDLGSYDWALRHIHFPEGQGQLHRAQERLKFDELFTLELGVAFRKHRVAAEAAGVAHESGGELTRRLLATVPFDATGAQLKAMREVDGYMASARPMNLLLQGDVGSGKTL